MINIYLSLFNVVIGFIIILIGFGVINPLYKETEEKRNRFRQKWSNPFKLMGFVVSALGLINLFRHL